MTGRNPARLLAPLALVATAVALFAILAPEGGSGGGGDATPAQQNGAGRMPAATATPEPDRNGKARRTYTVKPGDTPSGIAEKAGIPLETLLDLNPEMDPQTLNPGDKLRLR